MSRRPPVLLMTRPERESRGFAGGLRGTFDLVVSPLIRIAFAEKLPEIPATAGVIFSSANAVRAWQDLGGEVRAPCFTVGDATAEAARAAGFDPVSADGDAARLVATILASAPRVPLVHLHGQNTRGEVAERLSLAGTETHGAVIYDQKAQPLTAEARTVLEGDRPVIVPLFSPRTAALFQRQAVIRAPVAVVAMSGAVAAELDRDALRRLDLALRPDAPAMRKAVQGLLDADSWVEGVGDAQ